MARPERLGLLADTHSTKPDGSDLPNAVLDAFAGVDLIVHLGDIGRKGILDRLAEVAPVWVPAGGGKGYVPAGSDQAPVKVVDTACGAVGLCFNLAQPDKRILLEAGRLQFDGDMQALLHRRFKQPVGVVAFGGTHVAHVSTNGDVLFVNPGSPTLPADRQGDDDLGSVAVLDVGAGAPLATIVRLSP